MRPGGNTPSRNRPGTRTGSVALSCPGICHLLRKSSFSLSAGSGLCAGNHAFRIAPGIPRQARRHPLSRREVDKSSNYSYQTSVNNIASSPLTYRSVTFYPDHIGRRPSPIRRLPSVQRRPPGTSRSAFWIAVACSHLHRGERSLRALSYTGDDVTNVK